jgi:hypothetical protein
VLHQDPRCDLNCDSLQWRATHPAIRRGADKSLAFPIFYFPFCSTNKRIFLEWVKEVRTTKS